ncbi:NAD-binding protein [Chromobacterium haemolyticum]|nr:NAD-binding protein [Chromobacterium haemolyticum]
MRTLMIIGAGDVARRALPELTRRWRVLALCRSSASAEALRRQGVTPIRGDLDNPVTLRRLAGLADDLLLTAPPPGNRPQGLAHAQVVVCVGKRLQDTTAPSLYQHQRRVRQCRWRFAG